MEVLELKPVKGKKTFIFLVKKENNELTINEREVLTDVLQSYPIKFSTIDLNGKDPVSFKGSDLAEWLSEFNLHCFEVDIPEYAKGYLYAELDEKKEQYMGLEHEYMLLEDKDSFKAQNLKSWIDYLKDEYKKKKTYLNVKLKSEWIAKKILDIVSHYKDDTLYLIHFTPETLVMELKTILEELEVHVIVGEIKAKFLTPFQITHSEVN
ncbi:MAG: hypothetical protein ACTSQI_14790 [Candidatus Helarchaeota archaeon]